MSRFKPGDLVEIKWVSGNDPDVNSGIVLGRHFDTYRVYVGKLYMCRAHEEEAEHVILRLKKRMMNRIKSMTIEELLTCYPEPIRALGQSLLERQSKGTSWQR